MAELLLLLTLDENLPFTVSLLIMFLIAVLEFLSLLFGIATHHLIDNLLPESFQVDADVDIDSSVFVKALGWFHIGKVPVLVLLIIFLTSFGISGLIIQNIAIRVVSILPSFVASVPAFLLALVLVRVSGKFLARIIPKDETSAVSEDSFIGKVATITVGTARVGQPAEAKLKDQFGQVHYVRVEPEVETDILPAGTQVLLVKKNGNVFFAIKNTNELLAN
ncbi:MAG: YqiJ family protein [Candidatus Magnetoovum sp. WYHC-5]|nr:YqiJ family protein [Candidatus Magnetoovum sp. WYHC-5]